MTTAELLADALGRIREVVHQATDGLTADQLAYRPAPDANSIAWLVWHLTRVQDDHIADVAGVEQAWTAAGWARRFDLPFDDAAHGYGQGPDDVAAARPRPPLLTGYHDAVYQLAGLRGDASDPDLDRIVDDRWDPPVTLGVRIVSVLADDLQHAGQAATCAA
jgi:AcrR family transcriptional regulator